MTIVQNEFIESARVGFFEQGLSRGTYGLQVRLSPERLQVPLSPKAYEAVKQLVEEPLPAANKKARIKVPASYRNLAELRWLLAALKKFSISTQLIYDVTLGEPELLGLADWRILQVTAPEASFMEFDELWYKPQGPLEDFPLWPLQHPVYLYVDGAGRPVDEVFGFMQKSKYPWVLL